MRLQAAPYFAYRASGAHSMMTKRDVIYLYGQLNEQGIDVWIDGGWAVDALLGGQTRPHEDVDIVVQQRDVPALREWLAGEGYGDVPRDDTSAWNFVLGDGEQHLVDVHAIVFDEDQNGLYGPLEKGVMYPAGSLTGTGMIDGVMVKCISPEYLVQFHTGYKPRETDWMDVTALCARFDLPLPEAYSSAGTRDHSS